MTNENNSVISNFLKKESSGGIVLMIATVLALVVANTPLREYYDLLLTLKVAVIIGPLNISKPLLLWINDGLMAFFFFMIGLELKREVLEGELRDKRNIILPGVGAIGGMAVPALIYFAFNYNDPSAIQGWAIPAATDIAFALGILSLLGPQVPTSLKIFLTSLAIFDDIGAILIIAVFYTSKISKIALLVVVLLLPILWLLNKKGVESKSVYIFIGIVMWVAMLKSGIHATLAGVVLAMFIPIQSKTNPDYSPLKSMEHDLHDTVAFIILPIFAFANAGLTLIGSGMDQLFHNVPVGIALGLFIGKQVGIFLLCWLSVKVGLAVLPKGMNWTRLYGTAALCGIGFTMSLFIGSLAFEETGVDLIFDERLGILAGSIASGILGYFILKFHFKSSKV